MRSRSTFFHRTIIVLSSILLFAACGSQKPAKYRKKRGCDCPHWNQAPVQHEGAHAMRFDEATNARG